MMFRDSALVLSEFWQGVFWAGVLWLSVRILSVVNSTAAAGPGGGGGGWGHSIKAFVGGVGLASV